MSMLAFFPWLNLRSSATISTPCFDLVPFKRERAPIGGGNDEQAILDEALAPYHYINHPVNDATLVQLPGRALTDDLNEDERDEVYFAAQSVAFAGLAAREFFSLGPRCNADDFEALVQSFSGRPNGSTISTRRRDGGTTHRITLGAYQVHAALHITHDAIHLDVDLLQALCKARDWEHWDQVEEAIAGFILGNTDSLRVREETEVVHTVGAFERLLGLDRGKGNELARAFASILTPPRERLVKDASRPLLATAFDPDIPLREAWMRDFFRVRHGPAHGKLKARYASKWSVHEHLLLSSFIFPVVVKLRLHECGFYTPSDTDRKRIEMFEALCGGPDLFGDPGQHENGEPKPTPWLVVERQVLSDQLAARAEEYYRRRAEREAPPPPVDPSAPAK